MRHLFLSIGLAFTLMFGAVGCQTTAGNVVAKAEGAIIISVDVGMQAWKDYVDAGYATQAQVDAVKAAYTNYYEAQKVAEKALVTYLETAQSPVALTNKEILQKATEAASAASANLINLIHNFTRK